MQKIIVNKGMLVLAFTAFLNTARAQQSPATVRSTHTRSTHSTYLNVEEDTMVTPHQTIVTYKDDRLYHFVVIDDKIAELYVNSRKIPLDSLYVYEPVFKKISEQVKKDKRQAEEDQKQAIKDEAQAREDEMQAERDKVQAERDAEQSVKDRKEADEDRAEAEEEDRKQAKEDQEQAEEDRKQVAEDRKQAEEDRKQADEDRKQAMRDKEQAEKDAQEARFDAKRAAEDQAVMKSMIAELVKQGLIADKKSLYSLSLDENELILNGKKQSEAVHKQFMAKFISRPGSSISYSHNEH